MNFWFYSKTRSILAILCIWYASMRRLFGPADGCKLGSMTMKSTRRVLGHSPVRLLAHSHRSLIHSLRTACFACALSCAHSLARFRAPALMRKQIFSMKWTCHIHFVLTHHGMEQWTHRLSLTQIAKKNPICFENYFFMLFLLAVGTLICIDLLRDGNS